MIRPATRADIPAMHRIRLSVRENSLSDPTQVTEQSYRPYIAASSAWVAEGDGRIDGFAIVDSPNRSIWALFVDPAAQGTGIGNALHDHLVRWARDRRLDRLTLTTAPGTRAAHFYLARGWIATGTAPDGDLYFERKL